MTVPALRLDDAFAASLLPVRDPRGHKGTFGRVAVVAGSLDYAGAALMSGAAALRSGSGLVSVFVPASLQPCLAGRIPELITRGLPEVAPGEVEVAGATAMIAEMGHDALLLGPGLQTDRASSRLVQQLLASSGPPAVIDAGALACLADVPGWPRRVNRRCVLTPHPGELRRLGREAGTSDGDRLRNATGAASTWQQVVVLKGAGSLIADPAGRTALSPFVLPALGTAGSGDVLAGVIASLLGQGLPPFEAAALGVYLHARAGELASEELGDAGLMATDLLGYLPLARRQLRDLRASGQGA